MLSVIYSKDNSEERYIRQYVRVISSYFNLSDVKTDIPGGKQRGGEGGGE